MFGPYHGRHGLLETRPLETASFPFFKLELTTDKRSTGGKVQQDRLDPAAARAVHADDRPFVNSRVGAGIPRSGKLNKHAHRGNIPKNLPKFLHRGIITHFTGQPG